MKRLRWIAALACAAALLAALPALAPANVQVGSSGWLWGNPLPQGNTLRAMSFAGANGYAVGDFGTLLKTTDGGTTWSGLLERHVHQPLRGAGDRRQHGLRRRRLRRAALERRRRDLHAHRLHAGRVELPGAVRAPAGSSTASPATSCSTDGTVLRTDNNGDTFAQKTALPGTRAPGGGGDPGRPALPHRPDRLRRDLGRQDLPHDRRRELVEPHQRHHPRRALASSSSTPTTATRSATARSSSSPRTAARPGRPRTSASRRPTCARSAARR